MNSFFSPRISQAGTPLAFYRAWVCLLLFFLCVPVRASRPHDVGRAMEMCDSMPIDNVEGIWVYPDDNVTVFVVRKPQRSLSSALEYDLIVVDTPDCNLNPGESIGTLTAGADPKKFSLELFSERKRGVLTKSRTCTATLSSEGESMSLNMPDSRFKLRLNLNPGVLMPKLWRSLFRISTSGANRSTQTGLRGMIKIYPSYDGNGSSRRQPRYL